MQFIDTHCHLFLEEFDNDRIDIINQSIKAGVIAMLNPNIDASSLEALHETCQINPFVCIPTLGLHPCSVKEDYQNQLAEIKHHFNEYRSVAIGEIGIDLYWDKTFIKEQKKAFEEQLNWAIDLNLPVIIHNRDAFDTVYEITKDKPKLRGVFHAFSGTNEQAQKILDLGFYLGIGGVVTFKNSGLDRVLENIPLEKIVLETDSPYLTPAPHRGKRNNPSYLLLIATKIAEIKQVGIEEVALKTTQNAKNLFGI
jgi:TatD DNase family protein